MGARRRTARQLHDAVLDEISEHGAVGLSLRRVARRMGMSPAGLYRHGGELFAVEVEAMLRDLGLTDAPTAAGPQRKAASMRRLRQVGR